MKKKRVLITGSAGFIGYHLAKRLHERGDFVIGYDNYTPYYEPQLKLDRTAELKKLNIDVVKGDICDGETLQNFVEKNEITHIAHLAAQAGVRYSLEKPLEYVEANMKGFVSILELCRKFPEIKLTYASSSSVYGLNEKIPFSTEDRTDHQASLYGVSKKSNELLAYTYHHLFQIPVTGLRFFTVYGPWGRPDMAYFSFTKSILEGRPIEVFNEGHLLRDFTYIDDIIDGAIAAIDLGASYELFNLGNNRPEELIKFIELIEKALGRRAVKKFLPMQKGDVLKTYADIDKSTKMLGFSPKISLEQGIPLFIDWYKSYYKL